MEQESASIRFGQLVLILVGRHIVLPPAVNNDRFLGAQPLGLGHRIDGRVATTDHRHPRPDRNLMQRLGVDPADELKRLHDPLLVFPRNVESMRLAKAHPEE